MDIVKEVKPVLGGLRKKHSNIKFILLYGSFALGKQKKWSDVDIGIYYTGKHIQHSSKIMDLDRTRIVSLICRDLDDVKKSLKKPYDWIYFVKRIEQSKLIWQKGKEFDRFKAYIKKVKPKRKDFEKYTQKWLADILEYLGKVRNATMNIYRNKFSKVVATSCFWLLVPLSEIKPFDQKKELEFYSQLNKKPVGFDKLFKKIFLRKGTVKDVVKLARETVKYAEKQGVFSKKDWYSEAFDSEKIYELL